MGIHVIQSQRIEVLLQGVMQLTAQPSTDPLRVLKTQHFVAPSPAVQEWLTQKISEQQGISANYQFHQRIRGLQWYAYQRVLEDKDQVRKANIPRLIMKWRIYQALKPFIDPQQISIDAEHPLHDIVQRIYASAELLDQPQAQQLKKQSMLYWVAEQVSILFSHYMLYRGDCVKNCGSDCRCPGNWLHAWGQDRALNIEQQINQINREVSAFSLEQATQLERWQRWLWQHTFHADYVEMQHIDRDFWLVMDDPVRCEAAKKLLPDQVVVFTLLDLPPSQLQFLRRLGQYLDVTILHYNPSQEYWADSVDPNWKKRYDLSIKARYLRQHPKASDAEINRFFEEFSLNFNAEVRESRHPLLTRLGKQARDHFSLLSALSSGEEGQWVDAFVEDELHERTPNVLHKIQSDILYLLEPQAQAYALDPQDDSIQIHVCHSSLRQLEVLKEQLIHWLAQRDDGATQPRRPSDILVLVPDLKQIEPLVRSVFQAPSNADSVYLPVKMAGVTQLDAQLAWQAVLGRMQLSQGRFSFEDFADWLQLSATQMRYGLDVDRTERLLQLLMQAGFKSGLDAAHLQRSMSAEDQDYRFSFKFALDRLALGVAIPEHQVFEQTLSYAQVDSDDFEGIAILIQIYQDFAARSTWMIAHELGQVVTAEVWLNRLMADIAEFQQAGVESLKSVFEIVQKQERMLTLARFYEHDQAHVFSSMSLALPYVLAEIESNLSSQIDQALPTGQITFSQIGQLRPLPYQLIVMLNLDGGKFPNRSNHVPFDLMQLLRPQLGDRSRLDDDQGAFLDALLLAQQQLWLFYNGFDVSDGEPREPSSVLQELIKHLGFISAPNTEQAMDQRVTTAQTAEALMTFEQVEVATAIQSLFHFHPLQPFDPVGFETEPNRRYQDQWFHVAGLLQQPDAQAKRSAWVNADYVRELTDVLVLDGRQWIQDMIFPTRIYLKTLGVENLKAEDMPENDAPLVLEGLGRYAIRDFLQKQMQQQQMQPQAGAEPAAEIDPALLQDQLPVGKVSHSTWQISLREQAYLQQRLHHYAPEVTHITQRQWRMPTELTAALSTQHSSDAQAAPHAVHVVMNVSVPADPNANWISLDASSARAKRRAKVWLEYLLWLGYSDLSDEVSSQRQRIAIFSDDTLICSGLSSSQARAYLSSWFKAYAQAQKQPLVLPAALLLQLAEKGKSLDWSEDELGNMSLLNFADLAKAWHADAARFMNAFAITENEATQYHRDWEFLLQEQDATALLKQACEQYGYALYQPIYQYQYVAEE